jgi:hypothetical protein
VPERSHGLGKQLEPFSFLVRDQNASVLDLVRSHCSDNPI